MSALRTSALILAAGQGTRMKSAKSKVLHELGGLPIIHHVLRAVSAAQVDRIGVVVGHVAEQVQGYVRQHFPEVVFIEQKQQRGTGDAVAAAIPFLEGSDTTLVLAGDCPLVSHETLRQLLSLKTEEGVAVVLGTCELADAAAYGRVVLDGRSRPLRIVEYKDATEEERRLRLINSGLYACDSAFLTTAVRGLGSNNASGEFYLTDIVALAAASEGTRQLRIAEPTEVMGINSRLELAQLGALLKRRINDMHMANGVTFIDPQATYVEIDVNIGRDTVIYPGVYIYRGSRIGEGCTLYPGAVVNGEFPDQSVVR